MARRPERADAIEGSSPETTTVTDHGIDIDRAAAPESLVATLRRRVDGRFPVDAFGADPHLMDLVAPVLRNGIRVRVRKGKRIPDAGGALLLANRGLGVLEPLVLTVAVRAATGRRLRMIGAPAIPVVETLLHKLGAVGLTPADAAALLRAGHLAAAPLGPPWRRGGGDQAPRALLAAVLGFPVLPVAVRPGGPLGLPVRPWEVTVGRPVELELPARPGDALAAAELAERVRDAVRRLLARNVPGQDT